jgi:hypothetical protein
MIYPTSSPFEPTCGAALSMEPSPFFGLSPCRALALLELKIQIPRWWNTLQCRCHTDHLTNFRRILNFTSDILLSGGPGFTYRITAFAALNCEGLLSAVKVLVSIRRSGTFRQSEFIVKFSRFVRHSPFQTNRLTFRQRWSSARSLNSDHGAP